MSMTVDEVRSLYGDWTEQKLAEHGIVFKENFQPENDPYPDYVVVYEASFEPKELDRARLSVGLEEEGHVLIGVETYGRIKKRTQLFSIHSDVVLGAGHEPTKATKEGLRILFNAISKGRMFFIVKSLFGLMTSLKFYMMQTDYEAIVKSGYRYTEWISVVPDGQKPTPLWGKVLEYKPW